MDALSSEHMDVIMAGSAQKALDHVVIMVGSWMRSSHHPSIASKLQFLIGAIQFSDAQLLMRGGF